MIKFKLQKDKSKGIIFKINIKEEDKLKYPFLKRPIMEGKRIKGLYNYQIPLRFLIPIINNIKIKDLKLDNKSINEFLEFYDEFEEKHYYSINATPKFMKVWREENCPNIFKIKIDRESLEIKKEVAFKKLNIGLNNTKH
jgi:hypothetical protein